MSCSVERKLPSDMVVDMAGPSSAEDRDNKKICSEFAHLSEHAKSLFNGLRDLPCCGQKLWQGYFGRTFDIYTKLWKFQQQHRQVLDVSFGLKRWQIGEIASKIGQLYYHYYLRTSDMKNLWEAYSFYSAIRSRQYYSRASQEDRYGPEMMVKKLRYYARFIVVCVLMRDMKLVTDLLQEMDATIVDYTSTYDPNDPMEWGVVLHEIKSFIAADALLNVVQPDQNTLVLSHRLTPQNIAPLQERSSAMSLTLQEILLVGNVNDQVKFSEMTIDMFRMIQTLERDKTNDELQHAPNFLRDSFDKSSTLSSNKGYNAVGGGGINSPYSEKFDHHNPKQPQRKKDGNPHKYVLYKPSITQILMFLATGFKELPPGGVFLVYMSADGTYPSKKSNDLCYDVGGLMTDSRREGEKHAKKSLIHFNDVNCLYPGDLHPFTRKPLFVIVDSDNSYVFQHIPRYFGLPFIALMSPQYVPLIFKGHHKNGNLFTLFLHSPLTGFCFICKINTISMHTWQRALAYFDTFLTESSQLFTRSSAADTSYFSFFGDDFLRTILLRYVFCYVTMRNHHLFTVSWRINYETNTGPEFWPKSHPSLPERELLENTTLQRLVLDMATELDVANQFTKAASGVADF